MRVTMGGSWGAPGLGMGQIPEKQPTEGLAEGTEIKDKVGLEQQQCLLCY